jgi:hypothetical protein
LQNRGVISKKFILYNYYRWLVGSSVVSRICFTYEFKMPQIKQAEKVLPQDLDWAPEDYDIIPAEKSFIEMSELIARYLTYGDHAIEKIYQ